MRIRCASYSNLRCNCEYLLEKCCSLGNVVQNFPFTGSVSLISLVVLSTHHILFFLFMTFAHKVMAEDNERMMIDGGEDSTHADTDTSRHEEIGDDTSSEGSNMGISDHEDHEMERSTAIKELSDSIADLRIKMDTQQAKFDKEIADW